MGRGGGSFPENGFAGQGNAISLVATLSEEGTRADTARLAAEAERSVVSPGRTDHSHPCCLFIVHIAISP